MAPQLVIEPLIRALIGHFVAVGLGGLTIFLLRQSRICLKEILNGLLIGS